VRLDAIVAEPLDIRKPLPYPVVAAIGAIDQVVGCHDLDSRHPHHVRIYQAEEPVHVARGEPGEAAAGNLDVPPGHRLLRQPHGFDRFPPREERANADDLTVLQPDVDRELLVKVDVAGASSHLDATKPKNRIAKITDLALLQAKHVPGLPYR